MESIWDGWALVLGLVVGSAEVERFVVLATFGEVGLPQLRWLDLSGVIFSEDSLSAGMFALETGFWTAFPVRPGGCSAGQNLSCE